jgi:putative ABC transport system permease protein
MAAFIDQGFNVTHPATPAEEVRGERVSANFFGLLGASAVLGRTFAAEEDVPNGPRVVVLSDGYWRRHYAGDPAIIGRSVSLNGEPHTIIGVMPGSFQFPPQSTRKAELWTPLGSESHSRERGWHVLFCLARLKHDVKPADAQAEMNLINARLVREYPATNKGWTARVSPLRDELAGPARRGLLILMGAVGFVLLIGCANIANLLLARATGRRKEMAVRMALGAGRGRIVRQLLTESMLLALVGAGLGVLLAQWGIGALLALAPAFTPGVESAAIDFRVLAFTLAVAVAAGAIFGIAPALGGTAINVSENLKDGGRGSTAGRQRLRLRSALVVAEFALALVLLVGAGLLIRSFMHVLAVDPGFQAKNVLTMRISLVGPRYAESHAQVRFFENLLRRVKALPGVEQASVAVSLPLIGWDGMSFITEENPNVTLSEGPDGNYQAISAELFRTLRVPLVRGRYFTDDDRENTMPVAIINEVSARQYWPGQDPVGKRLKVRGEGANLLLARGAEKAPWRTIVGVVGNVRRNDLVVEAGPETYVPYTQPPLILVPRELLIRTSADPARLVPAVRNEVAALDKDQPVAEVETLDGIVDAVLSVRRFATVLLGVFASLALALAAVGIFSVMAYSIAQRTHEIGIRMALGARRTAVMRMILSNSAKLAAIGIGLGVAASVALTRLLSALLYNVEATDPLTFISVALLLAAIALGASYLPARRAMSIDPISALRHE